MLYLYAKDVNTSGDAKKAYTLLLTIQDYSAAKDLLTTNESLIAEAEAIAAVEEELKAARAVKFAVGEVVEFGTYPQTSAGNDKTPIKWLVLDRNGDNALLLSNYGLDAQPYNTYATDVTWEECTLRTWLNDDFINRAFTEEERSAILLTKVDNSKGQGYSEWVVDGGNNTQDKVFLLSCREANKYLGVTSDIISTSKSGRSMPTEYAIKQGASVMETIGTGAWWLRSPGSFQGSASRIHYGSFLDYDGVSCDDICVRPALWVNIESGIF